MSVSFGLAFVAGFLTFFATCLIPLLPAYIGYLGGLSASSSGSAERPFWQKKLIINSLIFSLGFIIVFTVLGFAATSIGNIFAQNRLLLRQIGGLILIALGIYYLEIIPWPRLFKSWSLPISPHLRSTKIGALLLGLTFGFAWTPCIGPVLGTILIIASQSAALASGTFLLLTFGLGLALPFILMAIFFQWLLPQLHNVSRVSRLIKIISGILMIGVGVLVLTNQLVLISHWFFEPNAFWLI